MRWTIVGQLSGAALMLLFLADIFLTILYARAGTGVLAPRWNRCVWALVKAVADRAGGRRGAILSLAGPLIVVTLIGFWALGLTLGAALIIQPELGRAIRPSSGGASTDFVTALLVAGNSLSIVGGGDYVPHGAGARLLFLFDSLVGASVLSLVLSYLVQVYSALRERNALALTVDLMTGGTGDASWMLARLMPGGDTGNVVGELGNLARTLAQVKEAHHFYPLLYYFRFHEPLYAVSRTSFVLLDLAALIEHALDPRRYEPVIQSAAVAALHRGARLLLDTLHSRFPTVSSLQPDDAEMWRDRQSYAAAVEVLAAHGIATARDGANGYGAARQEWRPMIRRVAPVLGYAIDEIDTREATVGIPGR
ncbi:potassium channel family protein [Sphingomonas beigongshangi]|uniref:potassium channel family protein n=1 Tax=Sphingomonas beigongshangi TaxID=2782540 RepID=UPI00193BF5B8|nr:potassium channel family protein [Sphingomonas beigongshangi]